MKIIQAGATLTLMIISWVAMAELLQGLESQLHRPYFTSWYVRKLGMRAQHDIVECLAGLCTLGIFGLLSRGLHSCIGDVQLSLV